MRYAGNFGVGLIWGSVLSALLWMSFFGWIQLISSSVDLYLK
ncbi:hypothetical protein ACFFSY_25235 [Paenibacillus aurantiacus]|uniref:Uncharacterized protein n=1 Tax=Paenibacillus aurantiacus TaxID=1936118 RepID=A0ABV5KVL7_9BACL